MHLKIWFLALIALRSRIMIVTDIRQNHATMNLQSFSFWAFIINNFIIDPQIPLKFIQFFCIFLSLLNKGFKTVMWFLLVSTIRIASNFTIWTCYSKVAAYFSMSFLFMTENLFAAFKWAVMFAIFTCFHMFNSIFVRKT